MGVFNKGKKNSKYSYLDEKLRKLDEDLKKTGLVSDASKTNDIVETPKITLPKNPSKDDIKLVAEYLETHNKSNWRKEYTTQNDNNSVEEEITRLRLQRKPQKKVDCSSCVTENDLKGKKVIKEEVTFEDKVNKILQIYNEGILNIPPSENTPDPLTPTDGKFVTFSQLNDHYNLFINRIQQQLSTLGGGGEVRLQYLDDIVGIATNASAYDGKYLKYNDTLGKFEFAEVTSTETQSLNNVLGLGNTSSLGMSVGVVTATAFVGDGSGITGLSTFSGDYNDLTNTPSIPSIVGLASEGYVDSAVAGISTTAGNVVVIKDGGSTIGAAGTIDFGANLSVSAISAGVVTVTATGGGVVGSAGTWAVNAIGIHTSKNVGINTTLSTDALTVVGDGNFTGVVTATRFESTSAGTPTIDSPNNLNINAVNVAISTDLTVGRDAYVGVDTSSGLVLTDALGVQWRLGITTTGSLFTTLV